MVLGWSSACCSRAHSHSWVGPPRIAWFEVRWHSKPSSSGHHQCGPKRESWESKGKRLSGGYAIVGSAFGGKRVAARWTTRPFVGFERREPGLFVNQRKTMTKRVIISGGQSASSMMHELLGSAVDAHPAAFKGSNYQTPRRSALLIKTICQCLSSIA